MPTSFVFNAYGWVNDNGSVDGDAGGPNIPTITASDDDGSIDVGDLGNVLGRRASKDGSKMQASAWI